MSIVKEQERTVAAEFHSHHLQFIAAVSRDQASYSSASGKGHFLHKVMLAESLAELRGALIIGR